MTVYRIVRPADARPLIQCVACLEEERHWDDKQAAKWKAAHTVNCPRDPMVQLAQYRRTS